MSSGWVPIERDLFEDEFWTEPRVFSRAEAYIDLTRRASFRDEPASLPERGRINVRRGQLAASLRFLAKEWGWKKSKVERFLATLQRIGWIETETGTGVLLITICHLVTFYRARDSERDTSRDGPGTPPGRPIIGNKAEQETREQPRADARPAGSAPDGALSRLAGVHAQGGAGAPNGHGPLPPPSREPQNGTRPEWQAAARLRLVESEIELILGQSSHTATGVVPPEGRKDDLLRLKQERRELKRELGLMA